MTNQYLVFKMSNSDDSSEDQMYLSEPCENFVNLSKNNESSDDSEIVSMTPKTKPPINTQQVTFNFDDSDNDVQITSSKKSTNNSTIKKINNEKNQNRKNMDRIVSSVTNIKFKQKNQSSKTPVKT